MKKKRGASGASPCPAQPVGVCSPPPSPPLALDTRSLPAPRPGSQGPLPSYTATPRERTRSDVAASGNVPHTDGPWVATQHTGK